MADAASGSRFVVDLGEVTLPAVVEKQVEAEIRAAVLRALATIDEHGDSRLKGGPFPIFAPNAGTTLGLWLDPSNQGDQIRMASDPGAVVSRQLLDAEPLTARDHTLIVNAVMEHPLQVLHYLPETSATDRPSDQEVLQAALQVAAIDDDVKGRIRVLLEVLPRFEEARAAVPGSLERAINSLQRELTGKTLDEKLAVLADDAFRKRHGKVAGLAEGMDRAAEILEDGRDSIYSPSHSFYELLADRPRSAKFALANGLISGMSDHDGVGACLGGAVGAIAGAGIGAGPGAVAGGAGFSVGYALGELGSYIKRRWPWLP